MGVEKKTKMKNPTYDFEILLSGLEHGPLDYELDTLPLIYLIQHSHWIKHTLGMIWSRQ